MKTRIRERILSATMAAILTIGLCPALALADDGDGRPEIEFGLSTQATMTQSEYNSKSGAFVNDARWRNGVPFSNAQGPKLSTWGSGGCFAYACDFTTYMYGIHNIMNGSAYYNGNDIRQGDVIQINGGGHTIVVLGRNGNSLYTAEGNYSNAVRVANGAYTVSGLNFYRGWHYADIVSDPPQIERGSEMASGYGRTIPDGDYAIVMTSTLGKEPFSYLDIVGIGTSPADGSNVNVWTERGEPRNLASCDLWTVKYEDGFYTITQKGSNKALDVEGAVLDIGTNVQAWSRNGTPAQRWAISRNGDGYRLQAKCSGYSLDADGGGTSAGTNIKVWSNNDSIAQRWSFVPTSELCQARARTIPDGDYAIVMTSTLGAASCSYLDIAGVDVPAASSTNVQVWPENGGPLSLPSCDLWTVKYRNGFYTITQKGTNMALDVKGDSLDNASNVQVFASHGGSNQQWAISRNGNGYRLQAKCSGYSLDADGGGTSAGTNIKVWSGNDSIAQRWSFVPVGREISKASVSIPTQTYTGKAATPRPVVTWSGDRLAEGTDYTLSYSKNVAAGTATAILTGKGSYTGKKTATFKINPASLSGASVTGLSSKTYNGKAQTQSPVVKIGGKTLKAGTDYAVSYKNNVAAGTAMVTVTGKGNYAGSKSATFKIVRKAPSWKRLAGAGRYDTMAAIVSEGFPKSGWAVVATGANFPDALAASALAGAKGCPVVLTEPGRLSPQAASQLKRLGVKNAYVMGGEAAVSRAAENSIRALGVRVTRVAGASRQETSVKAMRAVKGQSKTVIVATGNGFADTLSIAPWSYATRSPIVLTSADGTLPASTVAAIRDAGYTRYVIVGGAGAVRASVESQLKGLSKAARLGGADRYETSRLVAEWELGNGLSAATPAVATGADFPDALAGAALCGKNRSVMVLAAGAKSPGIASLRASRASVASGYILGGERAVPAPVASAVQSATR